MLPARVVLPVQRIFTRLLLELCSTLIPVALPDKTTVSVGIEPEALVSKSDMLLYTTTVTLVISNAEFTVTGFHDQERNLTFVKIAFQVLKLQFLACSMKQAFYQLTNKILCELDNKKVLF